jgi:hypothetical protein
MRSPLLSIPPARIICPPPVDDVDIAPFSEDKVEPGKIPTDPSSDVSESAHITMSPLLVCRVTAALVEEFPVALTRRIFPAPLTVVFAPIEVLPALELRKTSSTAVRAPPTVTVEQRASREPPELIVPVLEFVKVPELHTNSSPLEDVIAFETFMLPAVDVITADLPPAEPVQDWASLMTMF